jgi:hypothetical protein
MATPSDKNIGIERHLERTAGRTTAITSDRCIPEPYGCGGPADRFNDALSQREYTISGLCQKCQNAMFGEVE